MKAAFPGGVYALTPPEADTDRLLARVKAALEGGISALQYREKTGDVALRHAQASELLPLCRSHGVPLIINDDLRLADLVGADGVHLGAADARLAEARIILGADRCIGISCYQSLQLAREAEAGGADYVAFGSFYPSPSKPQAPRAQLDLLRAAREVLRLPIIAIGGITSNNAPALLDGGADALAVISAVFDAPDPRAAAMQLNALFAWESED